MSKTSFHAFPKQLQVTRKSPQQDARQLKQGHDAAVQNYLQELREKHPDSPIANPPRDEKGNIKYDPQKSAQRGHQGFERTGTKQAMAQKPSVMPTSIPVHASSERRPPANIKVPPAKLSAAAMSFIAEGEVNPEAVFHTPLPAASEAEAISLELPSRFMFYPFKDLYATTLRGRHLSKLARARAEKSTRQVVEVISSVLSTTDARFEGVPLAHMLTIQDYFFILYWQRRNSYTGQTFTHRAPCTNPKHLIAVDKGELPFETLRIEERVNTSTLKVTLLDEFPDNTIPGSDMTLRPALMGDILEWQEHPLHDNTDWRSDAEVGMYLDIDATLEERAAIAGDLTADQVLAVRAYERAVVAYGVEETIKVRCKECGASSETRVSFDAHSFLPSK